MEGRQHARTSRYLFKNRMESNKLKILVVDDDHSTREMYAEIFKTAGFNVIKAQDGVDGLDIATRELPQVIFTGIVMPRMDGFSMMEELKKNVSTAGIPVIISSHLGRETDRQRANVLGAKDFIVRDTTPPKEVVERINALFTGGEYMVEFNPYNLDAQKLSRSLGVNSNFQCLECNEKMVMKVKIIDVKAKKYEVIFVCPHCGWEAR